MNKPQHWHNCDEDIKRFVIDLIGYIKTDLRNNLKGIYLHGSLSMGSYYRPKSDIDLIVVVESKLGVNMANKVGITIANHANKRPTLGNIELSVITVEAAKSITNPTPYEFHYGANLHEQILNGEIDYRQDLRDPDLPSHLTYIIKRGICLYGASISEVFGAVKWEFFMESVIGDLLWILENENILDNPYYGVLNICRVFQLLNQDTQTVHSKDEGGEWGLTHLPVEFLPLVQQALDVYRSSDQMDENERNTGGKEWDEDALLALRDYARKYISTTRSEVIE